MFLKIELRNTKKHNEQAFDWTITNHISLCSYNFVKRNMADLSMLVLCSIQCPEQVRHIIQGKCYIFNLLYTYYKQQGTYEMNYMNMLDSSTNTVNHEHTTIPHKFTEGEHNVNREILRLSSSWKMIPTKRDVSITRRIGVEIVRHHPFII